MSMLDPVQEGLRECRTTNENQELHLKKLDNQLNKLKNATESNISQLQDLSRDHGKRLDVLEKKVERARAKIRRDLDWREITGRRMDAFMSSKVLPADTEDEEEKHEQR